MMGLRTASTHSDEYTVKCWHIEYDTIISARFISDKTLRGRRLYSRHIVDALGKLDLAAVRPVHVAQAVRKIYDAGRHTMARRVLIEARDFFGEALNAGIIHHNPAGAIKPPPAVVERSRLSMGQFERVYWYARNNATPWAASAFLLSLVTAQRRADVVLMGDQHISDGHLCVTQSKGGARIRLPLGLKLDALGMSISDVIKECRRDGPPGEHFIRCRNGQPPCAASLTQRFAECRDASIPSHEWEGRAPASLHELRSLAERLYRQQGIDTQTLLGHKLQHTTDLYNSDRRRGVQEWKTLVI